MKTLGIIGGLGPDATAQFYLEVIKKSKRKIKNRYPSIHIYNIPLPFDIEKNFHTDNPTEKAKKNMLKYLVKAASRLESAGTDIIAIPCNTVHVFIDQVRNQINIPILSIMETVRTYSAKNKFKKVGLLGTKVTMQTNLYPKELEKSEIKILTPEAKDQSFVLELTEKILNGAQTKKDKIRLVKIIKKLKQRNIDAVILGCTELPLFLKQADTKVPLIDTIDVLANKAVDFISQ